MCFPNVTSYQHFSRLGVVPGFVWTIGFSSSPNNSPTNGVPFLPTGIGILVYKTPCSEEKPKKIGDVPYFFHKWCHPVWVFPINWKPPRHQHAPTSLIRVQNLGFRSIWKSTEISWDHGGFKPICFAGGDPNRPAAQPFVACTWTLPRIGKGWPKPVESIALPRWKANQKEGDPHSRRKTRMNSARWQLYRNWSPADL